MSNGQTGDWYDAEKKNAAVFNFLYYLATNSDSQKVKDCIGNDEQARALFQEMGGIPVPPGEIVRVVLPDEKAIFPEDQKDREHNGPVIVRIPPSTMANASTGQMQSYILGPYIYWPPKNWTNPWRG
jgi:hypothetical protein